MRPQIVGTALALLLLVGCGTPAAPPTSTSLATPTPIRVDADDSNDSPRLVEAVRLAPDGATILLGPGTYRLAEPLDIRKPLRLVGTGMDETEIVSKAEEHVLRFSGAGPFAAEGITFRHAGTAVADVVVVQGGEVSLACCRFTGLFSAWGEGARVGLRLQGETTGIVRDCVAVGNYTAGILVEGQSRPTLEANTCTDNGAGIAYFESASGTACQNKCSRNGEGISVNQHARPMLERNVCSDNTTFGIHYLGEAGGVICQNECARNWVGIFLTGSADPNMEDNNCHGNAYEDVLDERQ
ncbi:MAG TPA: right-handed parallel beta-helix repeat-containing protein [Anaerolineae bacterium]|nr:right-handed parallel beta-helix repeat-containing protein [Anaerolineae bacterium]